MTLYVLRYNNYYNRLVKIENTINDYIYAASDTFVQSINNINFIPNDNVTTTQIINSDGLENTAADYAILYDSSTGKIVSRWFIMEIVRQRSGQYLLKLYRDLVADFYNVVLTAPAFIEKASLPTSNPLIYNSENMTYNQIKSGEYKLKDFTRIPWIVGYLNRNRTEPISINIEYDDKIKADYILNSLSEYTYNTYTENDFQAYIRDTVFRVNTTAVVSLGGRYISYSWGYSGIRKNPLLYDSAEYIPVSTGVFKTEDYFTINTNKYLTYETYDLRQIALNNPTEIMLMLEPELQKISTDWTTFGASTIAGTQSKIETELFLNENNKIIKVGNTYYRIKINRSNTDYNNANTFLVPMNSSLYVEMKKATVDSKIFSDNLTTITPFDFQCRIDTYKISYEELNVEQTTITIPINNNKLTDAPYDMFAIPYPEANGLFYINTGNGFKRVKQSLTFSFAQQLQVQLGSNLYDMQLVPYCPINNYINYNINYYNYLDLVDAEEGTEYIKVGDFSVLVWCTNSSFTIDVTPYTDFYSTYNIPSPSEDPVEFKVEHETSFYRMVSPNYNGTFEIKSTSNGGLSSFTATCAYKPYIPYIQIAPSFSNLYGSNFDDARGLLCGGDFSLPAISNAWTEYQINNKNYLNIFDRQIENLEFKNNISMLQARVSAGVGALSGVVSGAATGAAAGPYGMIAGAIGGGIASAIGGATDINILKQQQAETLDYTNDMFGYSLGNIQACPNSLSKVSAFNPHNKIFPILEFYTATDTEKQALKNKIKYNGMTVMAIGTIGDYKLIEPTYIKAKLIRLSDINAEFHEASTLAEELNKGVFI